MAKSILLASLHFSHSEEEIQQQLPALLIFLTLFPCCLAISSCRAREIAASKNQHSGAATEIAKPPVEVSLYLECISLPVFFMAEIA